MVTENKEPAPLENMTEIPPKKPEDPKPVVLKTSVPKKPIKKVSSKKKLKLKPKVEAKKPAPKKVKKPPLKRKRAGQPKKGKDDKKRLLNFKISNQEKKKLIANANRFAGGRVSVYLRLVGLAPWTKYQIDRIRPKKK